MSLRILLFAFEVIHKLMKFISSLLKIIPSQRAWDSYPNYGFKSVFFFGHVRFLKLFPPVKDISSTTYLLETLMGMATILRQEGLFDIHLFNQKMVILVDPELIKVVLTNSKEINKSKYYKLFHIFSGKGLIASDPDLWRKQRKLLNPMFHLGSIKEFVPMMNKHVKMMISQIQEDIYKSDSRIIDISESIEKCTLYIIADAVFDFEHENEKILQDGLFKPVKRFEESFSYRFNRPLLHSENMFKMTLLGKETVKAVKKVDETFQTMLMKKKAIMKEPDENVRSVNFMDIILQMLEKNPELMSDKQFRDEAMNIIGGGFDSTTVAATFSLYMLGLYPEIQEKVNQELTSVCGTDVERDIEYNDLKHLTYLENVIKESLRLCTPAPMIARQLSKDLQIGEKILKKDATCGILIQAVHQDPRYYPNPDIFDPDRFNPENSKGRHPLCYIPFAAGPRNCIGQAFAMLELKVLLANVLRHFRITSQLPRDKIIPNMLIFKKIREMPLHFEPRIKNN